MALDSFEPKQKFNKTLGTSAEKSSEEILEDSFLNVVRRRILDAFSDSLDEAGFSPEEESEFRRELASLPLPAIKGVLSMPLELRQTILPRIHERISRHETTIQQTVRQLAEQSRERGFTLGYHMSSADIMPSASASGMPQTWVIQGRERDHRDHDLPMAYYSTDLANLYGKKKAQYIYIVRAETGPDTTHRQDNGGSWGRAAGLDVVDRLDYESVMQEAREQARREREAQEAAK